MRPHRAEGILAASLIISLIASARAFGLGGLSASATISATPDGPDFDYTVTLHNTSPDTSIGTFWFAWTPPDEPTEYDFLPTAPSTASAPDGWAAPISPGFPGTSVENYNIAGSPIAPGGTGTFTFTSSDSPETLQGTSLGFPILTSFIYEGQPEVGSDAEVTPEFVVPEPSSLFLAGIGCLIATRRRRTTD